jgi:hypothetical protein
MLLLINRRYPVLGAVLGFIAAVAFILYGVHFHEHIVVIMGIVSLVLAVVRGGAKRHQQATTR